MNTHKTAASLVTAFVLAACSSDDTITRDTEQVGGTAQALDISGYGTLASVNGTYSAACIAKAPNSPWSMRLGGADPLPHESLAVVRNNTACVLTVTDIRDGSTTFTPTAPIQLTTAFAASGSAFRGPDSRVAMFVNLRADDLLFDNPFVVTVLHSDKAPDVAATKPAQKKVVVGTATAQLVPAPSYTLDLSTLSIYTDVDPNVVTETEGFATLVPGATPASAYSIVTGPVGPTWDDVLQSYVNGGRMSLVGNQVPAAELFTGTTLPLVRTLILMHAEDGVSSFQTFTITFTAQ